MLALARIVAGVAAALASLEASRFLWRLLQPTTVEIPIVPGVPRIPPGASGAFVAAWLTAAMLFTVGWKTRATGAVLSLLAGYTLVLDQQSYSNHLYLLVLVVLLLTVGDSGADLSLDAWRRGTRGDAPAWPVLLLKVQLSVVYVFSVLAKVNAPYLGGEVLGRSLRHEGWLSVPRSLQTPAALSAFAAASVAAELFLAVGPWSRRLRPLAFACGAAFHLLILTTVASSRLSLTIFALAMAAMYLQFVDEELPARWTRRVREVPLRITRLREGRTTGVADSARSTAARKAERPSTPRRAGGTKAALPR